MARPRQEELPMKIEGENAKPIQKITDKAEEYDKAKKSRMRALGKEIALKAELMNLLHHEGIKVYRDDDLIVELTSKEGVKVRSEVEEAEEEE
jgi:hypothetical protein